MHMFRMISGKISFEKKHLFLILILIFPIGSAMHSHQMLPTIYKTESLFSPHSKIASGYSFKQHLKQHNKEKGAFQKLVHLRLLMIQANSTKSAIIKECHKKYLDVKPGLNNQIISYRSDYQDEIEFQV